MLSRCACVRESHRTQNSLVFNINCGFDCKGWRLDCNLRSKRFQSSYCATVGACSRPNFLDELARKRRLRRITGMLPDKPVFLARWYAIPLQHAPYQTRPGEWGSGFLKFRIPKKNISEVQLRQMLLYGKQDKNNGTSFSFLTHFRHLAFVQTIPDTRLCSKENWRKPSALNL